MSSIFDGKEFIFNAVTDFHQRNVQITSLKGGGFVATWQSTNGDGDTNGYTGVVARIWNPKTGFGDEFVVNQTIAGSQADPEVIQLKDNRLLFGWESAAPGDVYGYTAYARVFSKTGTALHDEVQISSLDGQGGFNIEFDQLSNGMIVGSWYNRHYTGSAYSGTHQIAYFDPDNIAGATTTGFSADNASGARDIGADVLALADGTYVVNAINNNSPYYEDVFYHFDASGGTISGPDRASQLLAQTYEDSDPDAAQLSGGRVVMVWDTGISLGEIRMQIFKSDLTPIGTTQQVGKVGVNAVDPAIAATPDGGFVVVYNANSTITMVRYDRLGEKVGGPYAVSQHLEKGNGFPESCAENFMLQYGSKWGGATVWVKCYESSILSRWAPASRQKKSSPLRASSRS